MISTHTHTHTTHDTHRKQWARLAASHGFTIGPAGSVTATDAKYKLNNNKVLLNRVSTPPTAQGRKQKGKEGALAPNVSVGACVCAASPCQTVLLLSMHMRCISAVCM